MRGRTNVTPRLRPAINGDVQNFVVANGNTIAKGDFVSYVLATNSESFDARQLTLDYKREYDEVNHKFVAVFKVNGVASPVIMLLQVVQGEIVILDSVSVEITKDYTGASVDGTNIYICDCTAVVTGSVQQTVIAKKYQIVNDEIVFVDDYSQQLPIQSASGSSATLRTYICGISVVGTKIYLAYDRYTKVSSNINTVTQVIYTTLGGTFPTAGGSGTGYIALYNTNSALDLRYYSWVVGTNIIMLAYIMYQTSCYHAILGIYDTTQETFLDKKTNLFQSTSMTVGLKDYFNSKLCLTAGSKIYFYDLSGNTIVDLYSQGDVRTAYFCGQIGQNKYVVMYYNGSITKAKEFIFGNEIVEIDNDVTGSIVGSINTSETIFSDYTAHCILNSINNPVGTTEYFATDDAELGFIIGQPTNYVKEYDGGYTVGFAKTGGNAGSVIQVYVPHNNS